MPALRERLGQDPGKLSRILDPTRGVFLSVLQESTWSWPWQNQLNVTEGRHKMHPQVIEFSETSVDGNGWFETETVNPDKPLAKQLEEFLAQHPGCKVITTAMSDTTTGFF